MFNFLFIKKFYKIHIILKPKFIISIYFFRVFYLDQFLIQKVIQKLFNNKILDFL